MLFSQGKHQVASLFVTLDLNMSTRACAMGSRTPTGPFDEWKDNTSIK